MNLRKSDRTLLILLAIALGGFALYSWGKTGRGRAETAALTSPATLADTAVITDTDTLHARQEVGNAVEKEVQPRQGGLLTTSRYPGPPDWMTESAKAKKLVKGETIDLNSADTFLLQKVPGIGPSFARRIYRYRERLGGYYVKEQLQEVYGMDREKYEQIKPYFMLKTPPRKIYISSDSIARHPYLSFRQMDAIERILQKGDTLTWAALMKSKAFLRDDSLRLSPYLPF